MSDTVLTTLIICLTNIIVAMVARWSSHREHRKTEATVNDTNSKVTSMVNGRY